MNVAEKATPEPFRTVTETGDSSVPGNDAMMALLLRSSHDAFQRFQVKVQVGGLDASGAGDPRLGITVFT